MYSGITRGDRSVSHIAPLPVNNTGSVRSRSIYRYSLVREGMLNPDLFRSCLLHRLWGGNVEGVAQGSVARWGRLRPDGGPGIRVEHQRPRAALVTRVVIDPRLQHEEPSPLAFNGNEEPMRLRRVTELVG